MRNKCKWVNTRMGTSVGVVAAVLLLATVSLGHAAEVQVKGKAVETPIQGQQLCPATTGATVCQVKIECPPIQAPGQTTCQATIDCPAPPKPVKPGQKPKSP